MKRMHPCRAALLVVTLVLVIAWTTAWAGEDSLIPRPNTVTLLDLGANCKTCQMMEPMLDQLAKEYAGRADVIFINLDKHPEKAKEFNVSIKPTQIFFDRNGKEKIRHQGFLGKVFMANILNDLLKEELSEVSKP